MYNVMSPKAEEFINHQEILECLEYGEAHKADRELIDQILAKARLGKGISHKEGIVLLNCELEDKNQEIYELAAELKDKFYGNRIVMFAPLYLSNYCVNGCEYCPYHHKNKHIRRVKLTQEQIRQEVIALQDMGHKRLAIEAGEDPVNNPIEYILESIKTIYSIHHKNGDIRRVNVNIAATTVENYKKLKDAGIGTYILFQETYHKENYERLHPTGPKHDYAYHTEAMDRAMDGGIDDVGLGVLFGLNNYQYDFVGLLMHAEHLEAYKGCGPHTISVPRVRRADDIDPDVFDNGISGGCIMQDTKTGRIEVLTATSIAGDNQSDTVWEALHQEKSGLSQLESCLDASAVRDFGLSDADAAAYFDYHALSSVRNAKNPDTGNIENVERWHFMTDFDLLDESADGKISPLHLNSVTQRIFSGYAATPTLIAAYLRPDQQQEITIPQEPKCGVPIPQEIINACQARYQQTEQTDSASLQYRTDELHDFLYITGRIVSNDGSIDKCFTLYARNPVGEDTRNRCILQLPKCIAYYLMHAGTESAASDETAPAVTDLPDAQETTVTSDIAPQPIEGGTQE